MGTPLEQALRALEPHLQVLSQPAPAPGALRAAHDSLSAFLDHDYALPCAEAMLCAPPSAGVDGHSRMYALQLVSRAVSQRGGRGAPELHALLFRLIAPGGAVSAASSSFVAPKLAATAAELIEREFPQRWPDGVQTLVGLAASHGGATAEVAALALQAVAEDCADQAFNARLPPMRRSEVLQGLVAALPGILPVLLGVLQTAAAAAAAVPAAPHGTSSSGGPARVVAAILRLLAALTHFSPPAALRDAGALRVAAAAWDGAGLSRASEAAQAATLELVWALARRRFDDDADLQSGALAAALRVALGSTGPAWPTQRPLPPAAAALIPALGLGGTVGSAAVAGAVATPLAGLASLRTIASAVAAAGSMQLSLVAARAVSATAPREVADAAAALCRGFFAVSALLLRHPSARVRAIATEGVSDALQGCPRSTLATLPGLAQDCLPALCSALAVAQEREGRFVRAGLVARARIAYARGATLTAARPDATAGAASPASLPRLLLPGPLAPDADDEEAGVRAEDFDDTEEDEYAAAMGEVRGRSAIALSIAAALDPAASAAMLHEAYAHAARLAGSSMPPDAATAYGTSTGASRAVRWLDACGAAADAVVKGLPRTVFNAGAGGSGGGGAAAAAAALASVRDAALLLLSPPLGTTPDPCLRARALGALAAFSPLWAAAGPGALGQLLELLFAAVEYVPPQALIDAACAADAAAAAGGSGLAALVTGGSGGGAAHAQLCAEAQYVRQRACGALVALARAIPRELVPLLQPLGQRIGAVLATASAAAAPTAATPGGGGLAAQDATSLTEVLVLVTNALAGAPPPPGAPASLHVDLMRAVAGGVLAAWAHVEAAAAPAPLASPAALALLLGLRPSSSSSLSAHRCGHDGSGGLAPSDVPAVSAALVTLEPRFCAAADGLARGLHGLWAVSRRCTALELRSASAGGAPPPAGLVALGDPTVLAIAHPFAGELWAAALPGALRIIAALHGLWGAAAEARALGHPLRPSEDGEEEGGGRGAPPSAELVAARLVLRGLYCFTAEEAAALGQQQQQWQQRGGAGDPSASSAAPSSARAGGGGMDDEEDAFERGGGGGSLGGASLAAPGGALVLTRLPLIMGRPPAAPGGGPAVVGEWAAALPAPAAAALAAASRRASQLSSRALWHAYALAALALRGHLLDPGAMQRVALLRLEPAAAMSPLAPELQLGGSGAGSATLALGGYDAAGGVFRIARGPGAAAAATSVAGLFSAPIRATVLPLLVAALAPAAVARLPLRVLRPLCQQLLPAVVQGCPPQPPGLLAGAASLVMPALAVALRRATEAVAHPASPSPVGSAVWDADVGGLWQPQSPVAGGGGGAPDAASIAAAGRSSSSGSGGSSSGSSLDVVRERLAVECGRAAMDVVLQLLPLPPPHGPPQQLPPPPLAGNAAGGDAPGGSGEVRVCAVTVCVLSAMDAPVAVVSPQQQQQQDGAAAATEPLPLALARLIVGALALGDSGATLRACTAWERVLGAWEALASEDGGGGEGGGPMSPGTAAAAMWVSAVEAFAEAAVRYLCSGGRPGGGRGAAAAAGAAAPPLSARGVAGASSGPGSGTPDEASELSLVLALAYVRLAASGRGQHVRLAALLSSLPGSGGPPGVAALEARLIPPPPPQSPAPQPQSRAAPLSHNAIRAAMRDFLQGVAAASAAAAAVAPPGGFGGWGGNTRAPGIAPVAVVLDLAEGPVRPAASSWLLQSGGGTVSGGEGVDAALALGGLGALFGTD